jgi:shikimate kinase
VSCILIGGGIAVGKSTVAGLLASRRNAVLIQVRTALEEILGLRDADRKTLQERGAELDRRTAGRWLAEYLVEQSERTREVVVDAVRTERQTMAVLDRVPQSRLIYLEADLMTRRRRFNEAALSDAVKASLPFDAALEHPTEREASRLRSIADVVIESSGQTPSETVAAIESQLAVKP